ncbi:MAG: hypothetical protein JW863_17530 [Chitinispirillaceae bacterium]|nr:hypothetical protein [Chitinispirillaceae bacterium]
MVRQAHHERTANIDSQYLSSYKKSTVPPFTEPTEMKEVVDEILAAEKKVESLLSEARQQAAKLRQESENEASALVAAAQEQAQELIRTTVSEIRTVAEQTREQRFTEFREKQRILLEHNRTAVDSLVDGIVALITASGKTAQVTADDR